ncbi:MAG: YybH family protein [Gemmatimonadaceae bacterium]
MYSRLAGQLLAVAMLVTVSCGRLGGGSFEEVPEPVPNLSSADEQAIRAVIRNQTEAWGRQDAVAFSRDFAQDGIYTNIRGESLRGYDAFLQQHEAVFRTLFRNTSIAQDITVLVSPEPGVALVEALTALSGISQPPPGIVLDDRGRLRTRVLQVLVKRGGLWKVVAHHNVDVKRGLNVPEPRLND